MLSFHSNTEHALQIAMFWLKFMSADKHPAHVVPPVHLNATFDDEFTVKLLQQGREDCRIVLVNRIERLLKSAILCIIIQLLQCKPMNVHSFIETIVI